jgi:hypothetical protein
VSAIGILLYTCKEDVSIAATMLASPLPFGRGSGGLARLVLDSWTKETAVKTRHDLLCWMAQRDRQQTNFLLHRLFSSVERVSVGITGTRDCEEQSQKLRLIHSAVKRPINGLSSTPIPGARRRAQSNLSLARWK